MKHSLQRLRKSIPEDGGNTGLFSSGIRTKPGHFARFRSFALNVLRANGTTNVKRELYINALNPHHALSYPLA
jgi:hypothetical protein